MQLFDDLLDKIENNLKSNFRKIKEFPKYLDEILKEYAPIIKGAAIAALPSTIKISYLAGLYARIHMEVLEVKF